MHVGVLSRGDGSKSYLWGAGIWDRLRTYAIEADGFRKTDYEVQPWSALSGFAVIRDTLLGSLIAGFVLASVAELMLRKESRRYQIQLRRATLATLWRRGIARGIDLATIVLTTVVIFLELTAFFDLDLLADAEQWVTRREKGTSYLHAQVVIAACLFGIVVMVTALTVTQGLYGRTPGKWICGIRLVRTNLASCGFTRSLVREFLLVVESLDLLCWFPGILLVVYSDKRQRFEDIVADTIVIQTRPNKSTAPPAAVASSERKLTIDSSV